MIAVSPSRSSHYESVILVFIMEYRGVQGGVNPFERLDEMGYHILSRGKEQGAWIGSSILLKGTGRSNFTLGVPFLEYSLQILYMPYMKQIGIMLILSGLAIVIIGALLYFGGTFSWLGKLPGDIRIIRPGYRIYVPITTSILISIVVTLILYLIRMMR